MRAKMQGRDEESLSEDIVLDIEPQEPEDEWSIPERGREWGSILENFDEH